MTDVLEIEVDGPCNRNLAFSPADTIVRGRIRFDRMGRDIPPEVSRRYGTDTIPGQVIGFNTKTGQGYVRERLHEPEFASLTHKLRERATIAPEIVPLSVDKATMLHWMKRAVQDGDAKLLNGVMPEKIEGNPRLEFFVPERKPSEQRIANVLKWLDMPEAKRAEARKLLGCDPF
jgi:hypothetical protein